MNLKDKNPNGVHCSTSRKRATHFESVCKAQRLSITHIFVSSPTSPRSTRAVSRNSVNRPIATAYVISELICFARDNRRCLWQKLCFSATARHSVCPVQKGRLKAQGDQLFKMQRCLFLTSRCSFIKEVDSFGCFWKPLIKWKKASWAETWMLLIFQSCCFSASQDAGWSH